MLKCLRKKVIVVHLLDMIFIKEQKIHTLNQVSTVRILH